MVCMGIFITSCIDVELHSAWDSDGKIATWTFAYNHIPIPWEYVCVPSSGRAASRRAPLAASKSPLGFPQKPTFPHFFELSRIEPTKILVDPAQPKFWKKLDELHRLTSNCCVKFRVTWLTSNWGIWPQENETP